MLSAVARLKDTEIPEDKKVVLGAQVTIAIAQVETTARMLEQIASLVGRSATTGLGGYGQPG